MSSRPSRSPQFSQFRRRRFLQLSTAAFSGLALANCRRSLEGGASAPASSPSAASGKQLNIYTWAEYTSPDLVKRFTDQTGIQVITDLYDSNETMLAKLQAGGGKQYSIIYPSDYMVRQMIDFNLLTKLDPARIKGMDGIGKRWQSPSYDPQNAHSIPYNWGTTGLLYNTKVWNQEPQDWGDLWVQ
ncbi:MAG TPA: extracellular solute-binding protein, partial [Coleofasciculaceae cyanobacterium]